MAVRREQGGWVNHVIGEDTRMDRGRMRWMKEEKVGRMGECV
jgi:hypothetical protein